MNVRPPLLITAACLLVTFGFAAGTASAEDEFERPPIRYSDSTPDNCVSRLQARIDAGEVDLRYDRRHGYLSDVLAQLGVPSESQMLVFSKTSLQLRRISPHTPRAIYFNDEVYVGFCQAGEVLEISAVDPRLGTVFYTLDQREGDQREGRPPRFERQVENCLVCHSSSRTEGVPGHLVRSLYVDPSGSPILSLGSQIVDHTTPLEERWGGWYVTGKHGGQKHRGNLVMDDRRATEPADNTAGQNLTSLEDRFPVGRYLTPHSDLVALMVLEHQVLVHNRITKANYTTRQALAYEQMMNEVLGKPAGTPLESTTRRIHSVGDDLVEALLMVDEAPLTEPISGTSGFAETFPQAGPRDTHGRSLRDLDLQTRLFKYPCSYLIYSDAFAALPPQVKDYVWQRLEAILSGEDTSEKFAHLTLEDRKAIDTILRETKAELPSPTQSNLTASATNEPAVN